MSTSKVIITRYRDKICSFLLSNNRLLACGCLENDSKIGNIYIGKVKNVVKNINACFVEIEEKEICFLPFSEARTVICLNRKFDGRIVQGDELVVQVTKDALKTKQASVTCHITMTTDYFVFALGDPKLGISTKLSAKERQEIKELLLYHNIIDPNGQIITTQTTYNYGIIVRTQAVQLLDNKEFLITSLKENCTTFLNLLASCMHKTCFSCVKASKMPYTTFLSAYSETECLEVVTDLYEAYTSLQSIPTPVRLYSDESYSLEKLYCLETKLNEALAKTVWLKSGANLVIEQTECLTTIDVNSGKHIKGEINEDTIFQINTEAAHEAALQIRLRNLSGIIIIDFINMQDKEQEKQLLELMKKLVSKDKITTNIIDITPLGLMEITRKKINKSLAEQFRG